MSRFRDADWIRRRQIAADVLLRADERQLQSNQSSDSVRRRNAERWRRHEFDIGHLHSATDGQLFLFSFGNCLHSGLVFCPSLLPHRFVRERQSHRIGARLFRRTRRRRRSTRNVFAVVDAQFAGGRSNLAGNFRHVTGSVHERQRLHALQRLAFARKSFV